MAQNHISNGEQSQFSQISATLPVHASSSSLPRVQASEGFLKSSSALIDLIKTHPVVIPLTIAWVKARKEYRNVDCTEHLPELNRQLEVAQSALELPSSHLLDQLKDEWLAVSAKLEVPSYYYLRAVDIWLSGTSSPFGGQIKIAANQFPLECVSKHWPELPAEINHAFRVRETDRVNFRDTNFPLVSRIIERIYKHGGTLPQEDLFQESFIEFDRFSRDVYSNPTIGLKYVFAQYLNSRYFKSLRYGRGHRRSRRIERIEVNLISKNNGRRPSLSEISAEYAKIHGSQLTWIALGRARGQKLKLCRAFDAIHDLSYRPRTFEHELTCALKSISQLPTRKKAIMRKLVEVAWTEHCHNPSFSKFCNEGEFLGGIGISCTGADDQEGRNKFYLLLSRARKALLAESAWHPIQDLRPSELASCLEQAMRRQHPKYDYLDFAKVIRFGFQGSSFLKFSSPFSLEEIEQNTSGCFLSKGSGASVSNILELLTQAGALINRGNYYSLNPSGRSISAEKTAIRYAYELARKWPLDLAT